MSKFEKSVIALLLAIAGCSAVTAVEVAKLVERGLDVEISPADAEAIAKDVNEAAAAQEVAEGDMVEKSEASE